MVQSSHILCAHQRPYCHDKCLSDGLDEPTRLKVSPIWDDGVNSDCRSLDHQMDPIPGPRPQVVAALPGRVGSFIEPRDGHGGPIGTYQGPRHERNNPVRSLRVLPSVSPNWHGSQSRAARFAGRGPRRPRAGQDRAASPPFWSPVHDPTRPSLAAILAQLRGEGPAGIVTVLRLGAAGLLALAVVRRAALTPQNQTTSMGSRADRR